MLIKIEECTGLSIPRKAKHMLSLDVLIKRNGFLACCHLIPSDLAAKVHCHILAKLPNMVNPRKVYDNATAHCPKGCECCGWNWEHNLPAFMVTTVEGARRLSERYGDLILGLERIISGKISSRSHGLAVITSPEVRTYKLLEECFMLLGYDDCVSPIGQNTKDSWADGRRRELAREVLSLIRSKR